MTQHEIQKALYLVLSALIPAIRIYDDVPETPTYPFSNFGELTMEPWDTDDSLGREVLFNVHTWSRERGWKEATDLMDRIKVALHNQDLTVAGEKVVLVLLEYSGTFNDPDGVTRHGVQRFRILTEGA